MSANGEATAEEIAEALADAQAFAASVESRGEAGEVAHDGAVDAVVWACQNYRRAQGSFLHFSRAAVSKFVGRALVKWRQKLAVRPKFGALPEHCDPPARTLPAAGEIPMSADLADLPEELRDAVRLYMIDGYSMREVGLLMGVGAATVRERLIEAAKLLNPGAMVRDRATGERRLAAGYDPATKRGRSDGG